MIEAYILLGGVFWWEVAHTASGGEGSSAIASRREAGRVLEVPTMLSAKLAIFSTVGKSAPRRWVCIDLGIADRNCICRNHWHVAWSTSGGMEESMAASRFDGR